MQEDAKATHSKENSMAKKIYVKVVDLINI
jgi:hypothetical protein